MRSRFSLHEHLLCRTRSGMPLSDAAVQADRRRECVLAPTTSCSEQAVRRALSTACRVMCFAGSRALGKTRSPFSGSRPRASLHAPFQSVISCHNLGFIGMHRVFIFFFVTFFGITTSACVKFSRALRIALSAQQQADLGEACIIMLAKAKHVVSAINTKAGHIPS